MIILKDDNTIKQFFRYIRNISLSISVVVCLFCVLVRGLMMIGILLMSANIVTIVAVQLGIRNKSISIFVLTIYYFITVYIQLLLALIAPDLIQTVHYNKMYTIEIFMNESILIEYFLLGTAFCFGGIGIAEIAERFAFRGSLKLGEVCKIKQMHLIFLLYAIINIWASQQASGYIYYLNKGLGIYVLGSIIVSRMTNGINDKSMFFSLLYIGLYSLPEALNGKRASFVEAFCVFVIYIIILYSNDVIAYLKRHIVFVGLFTFVGLSWFSFISLKKWGTYTVSPIRLILKRITGMFDGMVILSYLEQNNINLGIKNFIQCAFLNSGIKGTFFYTRNILGLPASAHATFAAPIFVVTLFYGVLGMIIISSIHVTMLTLMCKRMKKQLAELLDGITYSNGLKIFILLYLIIYSFDIFILDGNVETLKAYSVHLVVVFLLIMTSVKKRVHRINSEHKKDVF